MTPLGLIGGTGLTSFHALQVTGREYARTPWGEPSAPLVHGLIGERPVVFLARHGERHNIPPHRVNYRANLWAMHAAGVREVVGVAAVGGIADEMAAGRLVIPDQLIDYTYGRNQTFFEEALETVHHIDFSKPYCGSLRRDLLDAARSAGIDLADGGVYGATQGPRLETEAEIDRMERDGCDLVGMTGMPEAALARELGLCYASCSVVANRAAGRSSGVITMEAIHACLDEGMGRVRSLLVVLAGSGAGSADHAH